jgi:Acyl-coenzyme A:6-aminopenicillanic acid acyl-transferase
MNNFRSPWLMLIIMVLQMLLSGCRPVSPTPQATASGVSSQYLLASPQATEENPTLASLKKVSDFPFYTMRFEGDYGFSAYLQGLKQKLSDLESRRPLMVVSGIETLPAFACTGFTARSPQGERLLGRNFDWYRHPALLLFTDSPDGYASVSMVDISYLGFAGTVRQDDPEALSGLLRAPYLPFDGMNERGLAVGMMAVPHSEGGDDAGMPTLDDLEAIRLLLDYAADVDQAIELLGQYNVDWGGGPAIHYLLADAAGNSAVVEFIGGKPQVFRSRHSWQISTNFLFAEVPLDKAGVECWRYKTADATLGQSDGVLSAEAAMELLRHVSQTGTTGTIWSVVYNLSTGQVRVVMDRDYDQVYSFQLR